MRHRLLLFLVSLILASCIVNDPRGYQVWVTNESDRTVVIAFGGEMLGDEVEDPSAATYPVGPGRVDAPGPFVDLERSDDGRTFRPGRVSVLSEDCTELASFEVTLGDWVLTIDRNGRPAFAEMGFGQRPGNQDFLEQSTDCVSASEADPVPS